MAAIRGLLHHLMPILLQEWGEEEQGWHACHVIGVREGAEIVVDVPRERGREVAIRRSDRVRAQTSHADGIRRFVCTVVRRRDVPTPCLYLSWPDEVEHIQRRRHVRIEVAVPVRLRLPAAAGGQPQTLLGQTADVSAGGLKVNLPEPVGADLSVKVAIELPESGTLTCGARTLRAGQIALPDGSVRHWVALQFVGITDSDRGDLERFVADFQREQIRRSTGRR